MLYVSIRYTGLQRKLQKHQLQKLISLCVFSSSAAGIKDIDRYQEKITVSLHQASLSPRLEHIKLGVVTREELPVHYR